MTALGFSISESPSRQLGASLPGAQKHAARTLRKHPGSNGLLSLHPTWGSGVWHLGLEGCWPWSLEPASATCAVCRIGSTMLPAAETNSFGKVQPVFKFGFLFLCMHLESCFPPEPSPCPAQHLSWTKSIRYLPVLLALSTRGRLDHPELLLRTKCKDLHRPRGPSLKSPLPTSPSVLLSDLKLG